MTRIVALEEHLVTSPILEAWESSASANDGESDVMFAAPPSLRPLLTEVGERRLAVMDDQGIDLQVLSVTSPGVQNLRPGIAVPLAITANNEIAQAVGRSQARFQGFATLPALDPLSAAEELRRSVSELGLKGAMLHGRGGHINLVGRVGNS